MSLREFNIYWKIENHLLWNERNSGYLQSPKFSPMGEKGWTCFFRLSSEGESIAIKLWWFSDVLITTSLNLMLCNGDQEVIKALDKTNGILIGNYLIFEKVLKSVELEKEILKSANDCVIIKCRMFLKTISGDESSLKSGEAFQTTIEYDKYSLDWEVTLKNSPHCWMREKFTDVKGSEFEVTVKAPEDDVLIEIRRQDRPNDQIQKMKCQIILLNFKTKTEIVSSCDFFFFNKTPSGITWHFPSFLKRSFLLDQEKCCGSLILRFKFFISNNKLTNTSIEQTESLEYKSLSKVSDKSVLDSLQDDFNNLLQNKIYSDVKLLIEEETIFAHKNILASRSTVFSAMFDQDMAENRTGTVQISDIKADTMKQFLRFLYTGKLDELECSAMLELMLAAEKYHVPSLKDKCSRFLALHLGADTICDVVSLADMVGDEVLKTAAFNFIKENAADVLDSPNWTKWLQKNVTLGSEIFGMFSSIIKSATYTK